MWRPRTRRACLDARSERPGSRGPDGLRPGLRHELKFVCEDEAYPRLRMALRLDRAGFVPLFAPRTVQSVYLDTSAGRALAENLAGLSRRDKVRLRWYGEESELVAGTLERKLRENTLGWKESL